VPRDPEQRIEPWPIGVAAALLMMIGIGLTFLAIAEANPDPVITRDVRPGMER